MGKLSDMLLFKIEGMYVNRGKEFKKIDSIIWKFWFNVFPKIVFIPIFFWLLKKVFIDYMLVKYGFEQTVVYIAIILIIRPMITDAVLGMFNITKK